MADEKHSTFWSKPIVELLGGQDRTEMGKKTGTTVPVTQLLKYERIVVSLNNCMPSDLYFRTKYTIAGYKLYLYSSAKNAGMVLDVDLDKDIVTDKSGTYVCKPDDISDFLSKQNFITEDESDDIDFEPAKEE